MPEEATELLGDALALWRGPALAEFSEPFARHEGARLEELRLAALEWRIEADLALGHHRDVVGELEALIAQHPLRERLRSQHMLALYRSGRHAEALASYQAFRRTLADELGIEPSASLRELERRMLRRTRRSSCRRLADAHRRVRADDSRPSAPARAEVAYARSGDVRIAYQVVGDGPLDLVLVHGWVCTFQPGWENPKLAGFYRRLASMGRLILFDKRGTGLSDRVSPERLPDLETRMDDVRAVMDAVGSERAVVLGISEGGAMSALFAATHPERTLALVLMGTFPREMRAPDYPLGVSDEDLRRRLAVIEEDDWASAATREWLGRVAPDILDDPSAVRWYTSYVRRGREPGREQGDPAHERRDRRPRRAARRSACRRSCSTAQTRPGRDGSRFMGEHIPGARMVELPGDDHLPWEGDRESLLDEIERFLAGARRGRRARPRARHAALHRHRRRRRRPSSATAPGASCSPAPPARARPARALPRPRGRHRRGRRWSRPSTARPAPSAAPRRSSLPSASSASRCAPASTPARSSGRARACAESPSSIGARIAAAARPGEVLVSSTVKDIVAGSGIAFEERGEHELAGAPGTWRLFAARSVG